MLSALNRKTSQWELGDPISARHNERKGISLSLTAFYHDFVCLAGGIFKPG
jgi:hypothetical protein